MVERPCSIRKPPASKDATDRSMSLHVDTPRSGRVRSMPMFPRLCRTIRAVLLGAAALSSVPSFEGAVLCRWSDGRIGLEEGRVRCAAPITSGVVQTEGSAVVVDGSPCGPCVDIPLGASIMRRGGSSAPHPVLNPQAVSPVLLDERTEPASGALLSASLNPSPPNSASHTTTPLRC